MNIAMALSMAVDAYPRRVAVVDAERELTYADLLDAAARFAAGVPSDASCVAAIGLSGCDTATCLFGAAIAGRPYAPLNHRLPSGQLDELVRRLDGALVVTGDSQRDLPAHDGPRIEAPDDPDGPAVLLYTSGTTAAPKAAALAHDNLLAYLMNTVEFAGAAQDEATLVSVPPFHVAGVAAMLSSIWAGRRMVVLDRFTADGWLAHVRAHRVTHAFVVPTMLARIVDAAIDGDLTIPSLRNLAYGGAPTPRPVLERALDLFGEVAFVNAYGLTETSSTIAVLSPEDHRAARAGEPVARKRLGSVGQPVPGIEVQILDEGGGVLPVGECGRVWIRGAQVSSGCIATEDLGYLDDAGYLFIVGRADDVIIRGGENIAPAEIEDALLRHPAVAEAVVVGVPDDAWGESIAACVVPRPNAGDIGESELRDHARSVVGGLKCPEVILLVDELPLTATGKVVRREVRDRLLKLAAGAP
jgi:acyl-CoA synthetase (AMP-forming)/AMP-acid ligase II